MSVGLSFNNAELLSSTNSTQQSQQWVANNGNTFLTDINGGNVFFGTQFHAYELIVGWTFDSRNRALFADRGSRQQVFLS